MIKMAGELLSMGKQMMGYSDKMMTAAEQKKTESDTTTGSASVEENKDAGDKAAEGKADQKKAASEAKAAAKKEEKAKADAEGAK